jgi:pimeloyl-ACP methyl ester carboxylesterase
LLAKLNVSKAVVLGISAGARSAVELALRHPNKVAALILIVPALYAPTATLPRARPPWWFLLAQRSANTLARDAARCRAGSTVDM